MEKRNNHAFTLVELLITATILGIISVAIIASFASGLKVYEKVQNYTGERADVLLSLEKIERDLRNTVAYSGIDFVGKKESIFFPALTSEGSLGRICYYLKGRLDTLTREEQGYARATLSKIRKGKGDIKKLVSLKDIGFSYYYYDIEEKEYAWKDSWEMEDEDEDMKTKPGERVPLGVRVEVTFKEGRKEVMLTRTVLIPVGYRGPLLKDNG
jgi:prepilin-type N-terminal cleavage/methylation domain-containing protein